MPRFKRTAHRISLTAMFAAMSLLFLYLASILPTARLAMYFLSSVFVMGLVVEEEIALSFMMFFVVSALSLLLMPNPFLRVLPYVLFFGHYGIGKFFIESNIKDKIVRYVIKLLYFNIALVLLYLILKTTFIAENIDLSVFPVWVLIIICEIAFVVYDFVFTKVTAYYYNNIRRFLMRG